MSDKPLCAFCGQPTAPGSRKFVHDVCAPDALRAENERLRAAVVGLQDDVEKLQQQRVEQVLHIERLRVALERIVEMDHGPDEDMPLDTGDLRAVAREALARDKRAYD